MRLRIGPHLPIARDLQLYPAGLGPLRYEALAIAACLSFAQTNTPRAIFRIKSLSNFSNSLALVVRDAAKSPVNEGRGPFPLSCPEGRLTEGVASEIESGSKIRFCKSV